MTVYHARQVSALRKIGLPKDPADLVGIGVEQGMSRWVRLEPADDSRWALLLRPDASGEPDDRKNDPQQRQLNKTRQVTLPATWMRATELGVNEWVYVTASEARDGLRVIPAAKVQVREVSGRPS